MSHFLRKIGLSIVGEKINAYQQVAGEAIFEIGRRLKHVKENDLAHGEFARWVEREVNMSIRHVNNFIRVYERFGNRNPGTDLPASITVLNLLTSFTDEQLEQEYELPDGTRKKPVDMSRRQIEELKRQLKAEQAERERLEKENEELARYSILSACTKHAGGTNVVNII